MGNTNTESTPISQAPDQSPAAVLNRIRLQLSHEADRLLRGRVRVFKYVDVGILFRNANKLSVWRPLVNCVEDWPLTVGDGSTFELSDLVETDHVRRHYTGSTLYVKYNPRQQFYYMGKQRRNEVLIFKNFDSDRTQRATC